jgi:hypothetical protein
MRAIHRGGWAVAVVAADTDRSEWAMKRWFLVVAMVGGFTLAMTAPAFGANPPGTGQPNQTCQNFSPSPGTSGPQYPGHASTAPGSVFNEALPGQGGFQYNLVGAPSQYDVACFQHVSNP